MQIEKLMERTLKEPSSRQSCQSIMWFMNLYEPLWSCLKLQNDDLPCGLFLRIHTEGSENMRGDGSRFSQDPWKTHGLPFIRHQLIQEKLGENSQIHRLRILKKLHRLHRLHRPHGPHGRHGRHHYLLDLPRVMLELTESESTHTWKKSACDSVRFAAKWTKTQLRTAEISLKERKTLGKNLFQKKMLEKYGNFKAQNHWKPQNTVSTVIHIG